MLNIPFTIKELGTADYQSTWQQMKEFTEARSENTPDEFWQLQHNPVFTLGLAGKHEHFLQKITGIPIIRTDRGGQVTYHGPGQIIIYTLIDLKRAKLSIRELVERLEQGIINYLASLGITASSNRLAPGVYVSGKKIASLGLGQGLRLMLVIQDYAQIDNLYQESRSRTIIGNCGTQIFLKVNLPESAERFSKSLGSETIIERNWSQSNGTGTGQRTESWQYQGRELMTADELMRNPRGTAIIRQEGQLPAKLTLKPIDLWSPWNVTFQDTDDRRPMAAVAAPSAWPRATVLESEEPALLEDLATLDHIPGFDDMEELPDQFVEVSDDNEWDEILEDFFETDPPSSDVLVLS